MQRRGPNILRCRWPQLRLGARGAGLDRYFPARTTARQPEDPLLSLAMLEPLGGGGVGGPGAPTAEAVELWKQEVRLT